MSKNIPIEIATNNLLSGLTDEEKNTLFQHMKPMTFRPGETIIHAGEEGNDIYFIQSGEVEVFYPMRDGKNECHFEKLRAGKSFGERSLVQDKIRTASVRAITETVVYSVNAPSLISMQGPFVSFSSKIYKNLADKFSQLLGENNATIITSLEKELESAKVRAAMGSFIVTLVIGLCVFVFLMDLLERLAKAMGTGGIISAVMLIIFTGAFYQLTKYYPFPKAIYGFTLSDWKKSLSEALFFSVVLALFFTFLKYLAIQFLPAYSSLPLFDSNASYNVGDRYSTHKLVGMALIYIFVSSTLQECLIRGGLQGTLRVFLQGKYKNVLSLFAANMVFAMMHLYLSVKLALGAFFIGLFWGWLFSRHQSLLGTVVSHSLIGTFLFFVLGIQDFFFN